MSVSSWEKIEEIFSKAVELPENERENFIRRASAGDETLRRKVLSMLNADRRGESYLENPVVLPRTLSKLMAVSTAENEGTDAWQGRFFGPYKVVKKLGSGGTGAVFLAERADGEFEKRVAVKIIRHDARTEFNLTRFRRERQILASLEHPFIARLLDGGTTDEGFPYLVMEYVEGDTLPRFCDSRELSLRGRLEIFGRICAAVEYAHERKIIHRDIKPSNIPVTAAGVPKLLDFGIAKILDAELIHDSAQPTATFQQQMTPEYASPEQVRGQEITAATDIYSLGVLLYEILTGARPYKLPSLSPYEIARVICEKPVPPLKAKKAVSGEEIDGELEKIVFKALSKKPSDRYASAGEFSARTAGGR
jgi:serine/threonine protein kinase